MQLANNTGGKTGQANRAVDVPGFILGAIDDWTSTHPGPFDLAFIIDRTGSMTDDIAEVNRAVMQIIDRVQSRGGGNSRLAIFAYADQCADGSNWAAKLEFTTDYARVRGALAGLTTTGGGDTPESVYDAVVGSMEQLNWQLPGRFAILIGDAGPHQPGGSCYRKTLADAVAAATRTGAQVNLYPILVKVN